MAGTELLFLHVPMDIARRRLLPNLIGTMTHYQMDASGLQRTRSVQDMMQHRPTANGVEYLREVRSHPGTLPGGEDDNSQWWCSDFVV